MTTTIGRRRRLTSVAAAVVGLAVTAVTAACSGGVAAHGADEIIGSGGAVPRATTVHHPQRNSCGGRTIDHSAAITSSDDLLINAPISRVWDVQTDVEHWDDWQDAVLTIKRLDAGPFRPGSQFRWTTPVPESQFASADTLTITSTVQRVQRGHCVLWQGPAIGESVRIDKGVHLWTFTQTGRGTLVHTEESWDSDLLAGLEGADADAAEQLLGGGLTAWLGNLKTAAEHSDSTTDLPGRPS